MQFHLCNFIHFESSPRKHLNLKKKYKLVFNRGNSLNKQDPITLRKVLSTEQIKDQIYVKNTQLNKDNFPHERLKRKRLVDP